jgi:glycosyltransferase involved in cell wall biosynthesis
VDSLLKQSYKDFELILVDDGSPDNCGVICDEYAAADSRVRVVHKPNGGLSDARNAGMEIARGEYIAFVDSDDWVAPNYLERLLCAMIESGADICECDILRTGGEEDIPSFEQRTPVVFSTTDAMEQLIHDGAFHQHVWNKLYRRNVIADILFPKGKTNEDEFWTYQVFGNAAKISKIPDVLYYYFQRPGSIMGETYSLKRLDGLEAKLQRQEYIDTKFPRLSLQAKRNLFGSCIYAGQMTLIHLSGEQQSVAKAKINAIVRRCGISLKECFDVGGSNRIWFTMSKLSFWGTCKLKNALKKGL